MVPLDNSPMDNGFIGKQSYGQWCHWTIVLSTVVPLDNYSGMNNGAIGQLSYKQWIHWKAVLWTMVPLDNSPMDNGAIGQL